MVDVDAGELGQFPGETGITVRRLLRPFLVALEAEPLGLHPDKPEIAPRRPEGVVALVEHEHVQPPARQPVSRRRADQAAADDDDVRRSLKHGGNRALAPQAAQAAPRKEAWNVATAQPNRPIPLSSYGLSCFVMRARREPMRDVMNCHVLHARGAYPASCSGMGLSSRSIRPAAGSPERRDPRFARIAYARGRAFAPARLARLIARARRRAHVSHAFPGAFSGRRERRNEAASRMPPFACVPYLF